MDGRNGLFALGVYLTVAMIILVAAGVAVLRYATTATVGSMDPVPPSPPFELAVSHLDLASKQATGLPSADATLRARIRMLENMLDDRSGRIREQAELLQQKTREIDQLQAQYNEAMAVALEYLEQGRPPTSEPPPGDVEAASTDDAALLSAKLDMARVVHEALLTELDALQAELNRAYAEIDQWRAGPEGAREAGARADATTLEAMSGRVLQRIGRGAVPALREALADPDPAVRRWAARVLGRIGPDAGDAVDALRAALADTDASVQAAAQAALLAIER